MASIKHHFNRNESTLIENQSELFRNRSTLTVLS
ncbi:hypothetical protein T10_11090 [Trichinella papuae]|uniref:Uncharacterized protein n=1 Tax=Trichinella papuae TaxID=268474 RepID=A0A0V1LWN7_9BILA|nr:hypothetical protein T10_11090 [Trichinella papuae]